MNRLTWNARDSGRGPEFHAVGGYSFGGTFCSWGSEIKGSEEMSDPNGLYAPNADIAPKAFDTDWTPRTTGVLFCFNGSPWETKDHVL